MTDVWNAAVDALGSAPGSLIEKTWFPEDARSRLEVYYQLATATSQAYVQEVYGDADYPEFAPCINSALNLAAPVPDYMYFTATVNGAGTYRLFGYRGTCRYVEIAIYRDMNKTLVDGKRISRTAGTIDLDKLTLGKDGWYEVLLSNEKPAGYTGDWIHLEPIANMLLARVASYDWLNEVDARLGIERLDVPVLRPRLSAEDLERKLAKMATFPKAAVEIWYDHAKRQRQSLKENTLPRFDFLAVGGLPGQDYFEGLYKLNEDECLVVETEVPAKSRYWSILVTDDKYGTVDWVNHQSSLNGYQARLDSDGKFRCVISLTDPGVHNWIDTGGFKTGFIQMRWNHASSSPEPSVRLVKLSALKAALPADTKMLTPAEREKQLRERRRGALMRRRW